MKVKLIICALLLFFCHLASIAQKPASDTIYALRRRDFLVLPVILRSIETNWGFGVGTTYTFKSQAKDSLLRTSNIKALGLYTLHNQIVVGIDGNIFFPGERFILRLHSSFSKFPDKFWGLGNNTPISNEESYSYNQYYFYPQLLYKIYAKLFLGISYEYQRLYNVKYNQEGLFTSENIQGRFGSEISGGGIIILWDSRNEAFYPNKGIYLQLLVNSFNKFSGGSFNYNNYVIDYRAFYKTFPKHVIAIQAYGFFNSGNVPIRSLAALGGSNIMRGYYQGRYRDKNLIAFQAEYRFPIWERFSGIGFGGIGQVNNEIKKIFTQSYKYSFGGGLRFAVKKSEKLNIRFDYGFGYHSQGAYLNVTEAF